MSWERPPLKYLPTPIEPQQEESLEIEHTIPGVNPMWSAGYDAGYKAANKQAKRLEQAAREAISTLADIPDQPCSFAAHILKSCSFAAHILKSALRPPPLPDNEEAIEILSTPPTDKGKA